MLSLLGDPRESDKKRKAKGLGFPSPYTHRPTGTRCVSTAFAQVTGCSLSCKDLCTATREPG